MGFTGRRKIATPFGKSIARASKRTRIIIPQPIKRPYLIKSKDLIRWQEIRKDPEWLIIHKRGTYREQIGEDPLEMRATPKARVSASTGISGSVLERIVYKWLTVQLHMIPDVDFTFQAPESGGRIELGGNVADFLFPLLKMIIQVEGPTHSDYLQHMKDEQAESIFADLGYKTYHIWQDEIIDETRFEERIRRIFNIAGSRGGGVDSTHRPEESVTPDDQLQNEWLVLAQQINDTVIGMTNAR